MACKDYAGTADVGRWLELSHQAVGTLCFRYPDHPVADVRITTSAGGVLIPGWDLCRAEEWREWRRALPGRGWKRRN